MSANVAIVNLVLYCSYEDQSISLEIALTAAMRLKSVIAGLLDDTNITGTQGTHLECGVPCQIPWMSPIQGCSDVPLSLREL